MIITVLDLNFEESNKNLKDVKSKILKLLEQQASVEENKEQKLIKINKMGLIANSKQ